MNDDLPLDEPGRSPVLASDIDEIIRLVSDADRASGWLTGIELDLGPKKWRPPATSADSARLLCVCVQDDFPRSTIDRLLLARRNGMRVIAAVTIGSLFRESVLRVLTETDSYVYVIDDYRQERRFSLRHCLAAVADIEVPVAPQTRKELGATATSMLSDGTSQERGARLEAILAFLFSQVSDLKVVERNYRTETEEIDLILQIDNFSNRVWQKSGVPFILVEAKNREDKASQAVMSVLIAKLQTKRGTSRIAFLVSLAGFTSDAKQQELRFSTQEICVVMIDREGLQRLFACDSLDDELETLVRHSLLR